MRARTWRWRSVLGLAVALAVVWCGAVSPRPVVAQVQPAAFPKAPLTKPDSSKSTPSVDEPLQPGASDAESPLGGDSAIADGPTVIGPDSNRTDAVPGNQSTSPPDPSCVLSSHGVRLANYRQTLFCIGAWFQDESPQERVSRVESQIEAVVSGRINLESLGLRQGRTLDDVLTPAAGGSENGNQDQSLVGIVSNMATLRGRDRLILLVTPLDVALQTSETDGTTLSPVALATAQFDSIKQAVDSVSDETAWVTFDWGWWPYWLPRWRSSTLRLSGQMTPELRANQELLFPVRKSNDFYNAAYRGTIITRKLRGLSHRFFSPATLDLRCSAAAVSEESAAPCDGPARLVVGDTDLITVYPADLEQVRQQLDFGDEAPQTPSALAQRYQVELQQRLNRYAMLYRLHVLLVLGAIAASLTFVKMRRTRRRYLLFPAAATLYLISRLPLFPLDVLLNAVNSTWAALATYLVGDFFQLTTVMAGTALALLALWLATRLILRQNARRRMIFSLLSLVVVAFAVVIASPHLPGAGTAYLAGVSAFAVLAFSLSAQAAIGDVIAGFVLVFITDLEKGDWVCLGAVTGELVEQNLFVHKVRTSKNVIVTLQNNAVLSSLISKFGTGDRHHAPGRNPSPREGRPSQPPSVARASETLIAHTTVTLGYDVPWRKVHQVLSQAAQKTSGLTHAFVLQTSLDDYYVSYELNAYLEEAVKPHALPRIYSELHQHIQDECNGADIEILSPHYRAVRDGSDITIPEDDWADRDASHAKV